jgi:N-acyl homoserine lactone hydrolase
MSWIRVWLRRILILAVLILLGVGAGFYILFYQRETLPAAQPHARVPANFVPVKGLTVCWVESGSTFTGYAFGMTAGTIVVKHPAGTLLIDTGSSTHFDKEVNDYPFGLRLWLKWIVGQLNPDVPLPELLRLVNEDPTKVRWAILSHAHLDHSGGLMDLPRLPVLMTREELQFAFDPRVQAKGLVIAAHTQRFPSVDAPTLKFDAKPYEVFDESADLYGDGSVVVVPLRGHTPGSVGVFVNLDPHRRLFYVGDAVDDERGFEERVGKPRLLRGSDNDKARADQIVGVLSQLHKLAPEISIVPAHGRSAYLKFFPGGAFSCVNADSPR